MKIQKIAVKRSKGAIAAAAFVVFSSLLLGLMAANSPRKSTGSLSKHKAAANLTHDARGSAARLQEAYGKLPLSFEAKEGQADDSVQFFARGHHYGLFLMSDQAVMALRAPSSGNGESGRFRGEPIQTTDKSNFTLLGMRLSGARRDARASGLKPLA